MFVFGQQVYITLALTNMDFRLDATCVSVLITNIKNQQVKAMIVQSHQVG